MKYSLILLLACVPLIALTAKSFVDAIRNSGDVVEVPTNTADNLYDAELIRAAEALAKESGDAAEKDKPLVDQLTAANLWDIQPKDVWASGTTALNGIVERLQEDALGRKLTNRFASLADRLTAMRPGPTDSIVALREKVNAARLEIEGFNKKYRTEYFDATGEKVPGADAVFQLLTDRSAGYGAEVARLDLVTSIAETLPIAHDDVDHGRYQACMDLLSRDPLDKAAAPDTQAEIELLRKRAQFGLDFNGLGERSKSGQRDRDLLLHADAFLAKHAKAPTAIEEVRLSQVRQWRDQLELDMLCAELKEIDQLEPLLEKAVVVVNHKAADAKHKDSVRQAITTWLTSAGFPRLQPPADLAGKQEAWTKNGQRLFGYFDLPAGVEQWRYWKDANGFNNRAPLLGDDEIPRGSFEHEPSVPSYVEWANRYNTATAELISQPGSKDRWQVFVVWCSQTDKDLVSYRERRGIGVENEPDRSCASWAFREQAAVARTVIAHWHEFEQVMRQ